MTRRPIIIDQRANDLAKIDAEIKRLAAQVVEKSNALEADVQKHVTAMDHNLQRRLSEQIVTLRSKIDKLHNQRFQVELGEVRESKAQPAIAAAAPVRHREWEIDENILKAGPPGYPDIVRGSAADDGEAFQNAYEDEKRYWRAAWADHFRKADLPADTPVHLDLLTTVEGDIAANHLWAMKRCLALEARLAEIEARPVLKYVGVWSASNTYMPGEIVSHGGSSWHSNIKSQGLQPGESNPASWTLMTKRGRDGRDGKDAR